MDIIVSNHRSGYYGEKQFELAGIDWTTYDITVVKLGYIWPELQEKAAFYIMSLTGGATWQKIWEIPYKESSAPCFQLMTFKKRIEQNGYHIQESKCTAEGLRPSRNAE